jgi:hypothetical protein
MPPRVGWAANWLIDTSRVSFLLLAKSGYRLIRRSCILSFVIRAPIQTTRIGRTSTRSSGFSLCPNPGHARTAARSTRKQSRSALLNAAPSRPTTNLCAKKPSRLNIVAKPVGTYSTTQHVDRVSRELAESKFCVFHKSMPERPSIRSSPLSINGKPIKRPKLLRFLHSRQQHAAS